jgi:hypothetical protein
MKARARIAGAIALAISVHTPVSTASAVTLGALCQRPEVIRNVLQFAKRLRFPAEAGRLRPDNAYFIEDDELTCTYSLTAGNAYDFGNFKATFTAGEWVRDRRGQWDTRIRVISLSRLD